MTLQDESAADPVAAHDPPDIANKRWVLVVGRIDSLRDAIGHSQYDIELTQERDFLTALAEFAANRPGPYPQVLVQPSDMLKDDPAASAEALRRICPHMKLVIVNGRTSQHDNPHVESGFDACLNEPVDAQALDRLLADCGPAQVGRTASFSALLHRQVRAALLDRQSITPDAPTDLPNEPQSDLQERTLGDVDLVNHLMHDCGDILPIAMQLLNQHLDQGRVEWHRTASDVQPGHAATDVTIHDRCRGVIAAAAPVTREALLPWAQWLARWLALEQQQHDLWKLALQDGLTGVWNRRYLDQFLRLLLERAVEQRFGVTVLVFDIDDFKTYNDRYGHAAGDEILRQAARLIQSFVRDHDIVARIGGDEFAVVFWDAEGPRRDGEHPATFSDIARRFQNAICLHRFPKLAEQAPGTLTISGGIASFPWDGRSPEELLDKADQMALQSKRQGKNAITFGPGAQRVCDLVGR